MYLHTFVSKLMGFLTPEIQELRHPEPQRRSCCAVWGSAADKPEAASRRPRGLASGKEGGKKEEKVEG